MKELSKEKLSWFKFIFSPDKISNFTASFLDDENNWFFINKSFWWGISIEIKFLFGLEISNLINSLSIFIPLMDTSKSCPCLIEEKSFSNEIIWLIFELWLCSFQLKGNS